MIGRKLSFYEELREVGFEQLQISISRALGLAVRLRYPDGRPITVASNLCGFCALLRRSASGRFRCERSSVSLAKDAATLGTEILRTCHAGLVHLAVPLRVANETVAVILGGNVALQPLEEKVVAQLAQETGIEPGTLIEAARSVPLWTEERLRAALSMVRHVVDILVHLLSVRRELSRKVEPLTAFVEFSRSISSSLDISEVAQRALGAILELADASSGSVVMLPEPLGVAEVAATRESSQEFQVVPPGEVIAAVREETRIVRFDARVQGSEDKLPAIALPLIVGGRVTGILTLAAKEKDSGLDAESVAYLTTLCTSLGLALENARLYRQLKKRTAMLERLIEVGQVISARLEIDAVVQSASTNVRDVLGGEWCVLRLLDESTGELVLKGDLGMSPELRTRVTRVSPQGTVLGKVLQTGEPVVIEDLDATGSSMSLPYSSPEIRALAVVPVQVFGKVLGTLKVYSPVPRRWSNEDLGYLQTVANQTGLAIENARLYSSLREYYWSVMQSLAAALEAKDTYTRGHSVRVARWSRMCARILGLNDQEQEQVYLAGLLHDVGKIGVRESVLLKPGALDEEERKEVLGHPSVGAKILEPAGFPHSVIAAVRHHHEDFCGTGYPCGLAGEEIPILARIIRVADAYDAMTSARAYRGRLSVEDARDELLRGAGRQFDRKVVEAFLSIPPEEMDKVSNEGGAGGTMLALLGEILFSLRRVYEMVETRYHTPEIT